MKVFLLKDIEKVGMAGQIITVSDGFAQNYLLPRKLGLEVTPKNEKSFENKLLVMEHQKEVVESKTSMLAERIKATPLLIKSKTHDDDKLYGALSASDIVDELAKKGISVAKNQVMIDKAIKKTGTYEITIKLSARLQPTLTVKIISLS